MLSLASRFHMYFSSNLVTINSREHSKREIIIPTNPCAFRKTASKVKSFAHFPYFFW